MCKGEGRESRWRKHELRKDLMSSSQGNQCIRKRWVKGKEQWWGQGINERRDNCKLLYEFGIYFQWNGARIWVRDCQELTHILKASSCFSWIDSKGGRVVGKESLLHCWWECKLVQPLWRMVWRFLEKLKLKLPYNQAVSLLGIYIKKKTLKTNLKRYMNPNVHSSTVYNS